MRLIECSEFHGGARSMDFRHHTMPTCASSNSPAFTPSVTDMYAGHPLDPHQRPTTHAHRYRQSPASFDTGPFNRAEVTGFEPAISALTGLHVRPLHHTSNAQDSTMEPLDHQIVRGALKPLDR